MKNTLNSYFDNIYCINLSKDTERFSNMQKIFNYFNIKVDRWTATTDCLFKQYVQLIADDNLKSTYLACLNSHISIMEDALAKGYDKILIMEDDIVPVKNLNEQFDTFIQEVPDNWNLLYLSYIRTNDDKSIWISGGPEIEDTKISNNIVPAKNFWSCMCYGINKSMMEYTVNWYKSNKPIEIDKFFVEHVQKSNTFSCYGSIPQLFAGIDNYSNTENENLSIFQRSTNIAYQRKEHFMFPEDINIIHPNDYYDGIFCINVLKNTERWNIVNERFKKQGLKVSQFNAYTPDDEIVINKYNMIKDTQPPTFNYHTNIRTLSAFLSHMKLIKHCIDMQYNKVLIMEDDVIFRKDFILQFNESIKNYPQDFGIWFLGAFQYDWNKTLKINDNFYETSECLGLFAYSLTLDGAKQLYAELEKLVDLNWPIDLAIRDGIMKYNKLKIAISWPYIIGHDNNVSSTNGDFIDMSRWFKPEIFEV